MNETLLKEILIESLQREGAEFDNAPEHKFSHKHRSAMKRIFKIYERNVQKLNETPLNKTAPTQSYISCRHLKQRLLIALCIIILMTFLMGCVSVFVSKNFRGIIYRDNAQVKAINLNSAPDYIKYSYALSNVPEGFEITEAAISPMAAYTLYENKLLNQKIALFQWVKCEFYPCYHIENNLPEEVNINGDTGLCIDYSNNAHKQTLIVWDNGDYIMEIEADMDKESTIRLADIDKIPESGFYIKAEV